MVTNFNEKQIVEFQDLLFTNGCNFINSIKFNFKSQEIFKLINNIRYFKNVAYISNLKIQFETIGDSSNISMTDLRKDLNEQGIFQNDHAITEYFLETFYYDLLILERDQENKNICDKVLKILKSLALDKNLPILIFD